MALQEKQSRLMEWSEFCDFFLFGHFIQVYLSPI